MIAILLYLLESKFLTLLLAHWGERAIQGKMIRELFTVHAGRKFQGRTTRRGRGKFEIFTSVTVAMASPFRIRNRRSRARLG